MLLCFSTMILRFKCDSPENVNAKWDSDEIPDKPNLMPCHEFMRTVPYPHSIFLESSG